MKISSVNLEKPCFPNLEFHGPNPLRVSELVSLRANEADAYKNKTFSIPNMCSYILENFIRFRHSKNTILLEYRSIFSQYHICILEISTYLLFCREFDQGNYEDNQNMVVLNCTSQV